MHRHLSILGFAILLALTTSTIWGGGKAIAQDDGFPSFQSQTPEFQSQTPEFRPSQIPNQPLYQPELIQSEIVQPGIAQPEIIQSELQLNQPQLNQPQISEPIVQPFPLETVQPQVTQPETIIVPELIQTEIIQPEIALPPIALPEVFEQPVIFQPTRRKLGKPKDLAPGVLKPIPTDLNPRDMFSIQRPLPGLKANQFTPKSIPSQQTLHGQSRRVMLLRDNVWQYEFAFTGLRQARLKLPMQDGQLVDRNVWYLVYRIRDTGKTMTFEQVKFNPEFEHIKNELRRDQPIAAESKKFLPRFSLEGWVASHTVNQRYRKVTYRDKISPAILAQIQRREDPNQKLLDGHQMSQAKIPVAKNASDPGLWGVALWTNVDPRIDYVSVYVKGLTNAFRLGRDFDDPSKLKTLQLNFWRPGDQVEEDDDVVDFGIPLVDNPAEQATICRRYNLPGPVLRGYHVNQVAKRNVLVMEADADVSLEDFQSRLTPTLDQGSLPAQMVDAFARSGINVDKGAALTTIIPGKRWGFQQGGQQYIMALEPQFWESNFGSIRFIKSLDHIWIYR